MYKNKPKPSLFPFPLAIGLIAAHIIGIFYLRHSNLATYERMLQITSAGFLPIPYGKAAARLEYWQPAFWGALFFTLSVGAGLSIAAWALTRAWKVPFQRSRPFAILIIAAWSVLVIWLNYQGISPAGTVYAVVVPAATALATAFGPKPPRLQIQWALTPLVLLTALWATQLDSQLFINIRDYLLLSNRPGQAVNDFYYRYTMYPAQSFKNFAQQSVRTCSTDNIGPEAANIRRALLSNDIIPVTDQNHAQLLVSRVGSRLSLSDPDGDRILVMPIQLLSNPQWVIEKFSASTDKQANFRLLTYYSLLVGFPVLLYLAVFNGLLWAIHWFWDRQAAPLAALFCVLLGCALLWPVYSGTRSMKSLSSPNLPNALDSPDWHLRLAALKHMGRHGQDPASYGSYRNLITNGRIVERYWLAKVLGFSRTPATLADLYRMLDDPHPNVVCQAMASLASRSDPKAIGRIHTKLVTTDHWYIQWYAYNALRRLGWKQGK